MWNRSLEHTNSRSRSRPRSVSISLLLLRTSGQMQYAHGPRFPPSPFSHSSLPHFLIRAGRSPNWESAHINNNTVTTVKLTHANWSTKQTLRQGQHLDSKGAVHLTATHIVVVFHYTVTHWTRCNTTWHGQKTRLQLRAAACRRASKNILYSGTPLPLAHLPPPPIFQRPFRTPWRKNAGRKKTKYYYLDLTVYLHHQDHCRMSPLGRRWGPLALPKASTYFISPPNVPFNI